MISNFSQLFEKMTENTLQIATNYMDIVQASKALNNSINIDAMLPEHTPWDNFGTKLTTLLRDATIVSHDETMLHFTYREFSVCLTLGINDDTDDLERDFGVIRFADDPANDIRIDDCTDDHTGNYKVTTSIIQIS